MYDGVAPTPVAVIRVNQIYLDYQKRGFFRIGVLPLLVLDGFCLELRDPTRIAAALTNASAQFHLKGRNASALEGRDFSISFASLGGGSVRARLVRLETGSEWRLSHGTVEKPGMPPVPFSQASLKMAGLEVGKLSCDTTNGPFSINLLSLLNQNPTPLSKP